MSGAGSPSFRPGRVQLNLQQNIKRQTDPYGKAMKKVNKRIKQNNIYLNKLPNILV